MMAYDIEEMFSLGGMHQSTSVMMVYGIKIPHVGVHQSAFDNMGYRNCEIYKLLSNDKKGEIHRTESVMNVNCVDKVKQRT